MVIPLIVIRRLHGEKVVIESDPGFDRGHLVKPMDGTSDFLAFPR